MYQQPSKLRLQSGFLSLLLLLISSYNQFTEACVCIDRGLPQDFFNDNKHLMKVSIIGRAWDGKKNNMDRTRVHVAKVIKNYKGETNKDEYILITSPSSINHSCGVTLSNGWWVVGMTALPNGGEDGGLSVYRTEACHYYQKWSKLKEPERAFLSNRMFCDEKGACTCGGNKEPVNCLIDPCESSVCDSGLTCIPNYCSGCKAEWIDSRGWLQCQCMKEDKTCPLLF